MIFLPERFEKSKRIIMKPNIGYNLIISGLWLLIWVDCSIIIVEDAKGTLNIFHFIIIYSQLK